MALYQLPDGTEITTHSMLKCFARCPNQAKYKYHMRLKPRFISRREQPLRRGSWFHKLLEEYYGGKGWTTAHAELTSAYEDLMDEEKDNLGNLPGEMSALMTSYLWHYGVDKTKPFHGWEVLGTEQTLECPWPDGKGIYRMRLDLLVRGEFGEVCIVDHKTHKQLPHTDFRVMDKASALYLWCAQENGLPVEKFIWNYIKAKAPSKPKLLKSGDRLSSAACDTDYPTYVSAIKEYGLNWRDYAPKLRELKSQRWDPEGGIQSSSFFSRQSLNKDPNLIARVVAEAMKTRDRMHNYDFTVSECTLDRGCEYACSFLNLCTTETLASNESPEYQNLLRQRYKVADPLEYYQDKKEAEEGI